MCSDSVTRWLDDLPQGDAQAVEMIVKRYYEPIVRLLRQKLPARARRGGDEEDVALSALNSFVQRARDGQFPGVRTRDDLWRMLVIIGVRKAANHRNRETAQKRGGKDLRGESVFGELTDGLEQAAQAGNAPDAELQAEESVRLILDFLEGLEDPKLRNIALWKSEGISNRQIAEQLHCSVKTVERKLKRLHDKAKQWAEQAM